MSPSLACITVPMAKSRGKEKEKEKEKEVEPQDLAKFPKAVWQQVLTNNLSRWTITILVASSTAWEKRKGRRSIRGFKERKRKKEKGKGKGKEKGKRKKEKGKKEKRKEKERTRHHGFYLRLFLLWSLLLHVLHQRIRRRHVAPHDHHQSHHDQTSWNEKKKNLKKN